MLSRRLPTDLGPTALARAREERGSVPYDLTVSNPTACGFPYPPDLLDALATPAGLTYRPEPLGLLDARRAIAEDHARRGIPIDPERIVLAASTSEAYALLFKLLGDPGDSVLVPSPSYPLLHHLATLEGLRPVPYRLMLEDDWQPDVADLDRETTRAIVAVHPNNPTGSFVTPRARDALVDTCARTGAALVVDEVFLDYPLSAGVAARSFVDEERVLTFCLGGLSKQVGLPQLKLSWIVVSGPEADARQAIERLAFVADQYLSVNTPVQLALPRLLDRGRVVRDAIRVRARRNLDALVRAASTVASVTVLFPQGGWCAIVRVPAVHDDEELALDLLRSDGVAVHPGYFFDFSTDGFFVLSLLPEPAVFDAGVARFLARISA